MNIEEAKAYIHQHPERVLQKAKHTGFICPKCGNGKGTSGTGITLDPTDSKKEHYKCFVCGAYGDAIELYGQSGDFMTDLKRACDKAGITLDTNSQRPKEHNKQPKERTMTAKVEQIKEKPVDYTNFFTECAHHLTDTDYIAKRGIDEELAYKYTLGYCKSWINPKATKAPATERLIIPTGQFSYVARAIKDGVEPRYCKVGEANILGLEYLKEYKEPVFIVEGELDALSVLQCGHASVGLGSVANTKKLLDYISKNNLKMTFVVALDNDEAGKKASAELKAGLDRLGQKSIVFNPYRDTKDANELLVKSKEALADELEKGVALAHDEEEREKNEYLRTSTRYYIDDFIAKTDSRINTPYTPTGFTDLDKVLDGGLFEGLYVIGAISSLGKTTFALQVADNIARSGQDVLVFSLEQSRFELVAKSISRLTAELAQNRLEPTLAKSARDITVYERLNRFNDDEIENLMNAREMYKTDISEHIFIREGVNDISVNDIREGIEKHIRITGNRPVVIIDYLQILAPIDTKRNYTDKQITDLSVSELKRISRDNKVAIIGISSFNRENYTTTANMGAFKESGSIEYSSDVLIGLQLKGIADIKQSANAKNEANKFIDAEKEKEVRSIELKILKNRNGATGATIEYTYKARYNYFTEIGRVFKTPAQIEQ